MAENEPTEVHIAKVPRLDLMSEEDKKSYFLNLAKEMSKPFRKFL